MDQERECQRLPGPVQPDEQLQRREDSHDYQERNPDDHSVIPHKRKDILYPDPGIQDGRKHQVLFELERFEEREDQQIM